MNKRFIAFWSALKNLPIKSQVVLNNYFDTCDRLGIGILIATFVSPLIRPELSKKVFLISLSFGVVLVILGLLKDAIIKAKKNDNDNGR